MTLTELFAPLTSAQEFPVPHVFVYVGPEIKSLKVKELPEYETMYKFSGEYKSEKSNIYNAKKIGWTLPVLEAK